MMHEQLKEKVLEANLDLVNMQDSEFDAPLGESTGAAVIFGATGGVIEAATRTAYEVHTGKSLESVDFKQLRGMEGIRSATVDFDGLDVKIGIAHGLGNARKLLEEVKAGKSEYHAIEIMACPGGCIGGGGQPLHHGNAAILKARASAIYEEDRAKEIRKSHENPFIRELYTEYLGEPMSEKEHMLLHTSYFNKRNRFFQL